MTVEIAVMNAETADGFAETAVLAEETGFAGTSEFAETVETHGFAETVEFAETADFAQVLFGECVCRRYTTS